MSKIETKERKVPWWAEGLTFKEYQEVSRYSYHKVYREDNREKVRARNSARKKKVKQATPKWLTDEHKMQIEAIFQEAKILEQYTGIPHEVDHIIPLKGKNVSGLHVPWNLQVLPKNDNRKKGNKILVDNT